MIIDIEEYARMSETGKSILRLIQNNRTAALDLLVRESLQNSLDASLGDDYVDVNFINGSFDSDQLATYFDGIEDKLKKRFIGKQKYIAVKDSNTQGLTGPLRALDCAENSTGNLLKLVYEISKPQEIEGSGGCWGLGKTVYYRVGIGLVLFYSHIWNTDINQYESRLAAVLIEDETSENTLLPKKKLGRGIAWWGEADSEQAGKTVPITDEKEILSILSVFGIEPYNDTETGTTVIIPYIDEVKLLKETFPHSEDEGVLPYWTQGSVSDYISIAAQRWYAPRINNEKYSYGSYLRVFIDGRQITDFDIAPFFRLVRSLYNADPGDDSEFDGQRIICKEVEARKIIDTSKYRPILGWISFTKVNVENMKMTPPNNLESPYRYINKEPDLNYNNPIIMFTRKPGMIVSYELSGDWADKLPTTNKDEFLVGIFQAATDVRLLKYDCSLEEYLRKGEKADHMTWGDWTSEKYPDYHPAITMRIQRGVRKRIQENYADMSREQVSKRNLGLGKMLADFLLPPEGFSSWDSGFGGGKGPGGSGGDGHEENPPQKEKEKKSGSRLSMEVNGNPDFSEGSINQSIRIIFGRKSKCRVEAYVISETGNMDCVSWNNKIGSEFPIKINSFIVQQITKRKAKKPAKIFEGFQRIINNEELQDISFEFDDGNLSRSYFQIDVKNPDNYIIEGILNYTILDPGINGSFSVREGI